MKRLTTLSTTIALLGSLFSGTISMANDGGAYLSPGGKVAFYDLKKVHAESKWIHEIKASFEARRAAKSKELQELIKGLETAGKQTPPAPPNSARQAFNDPRTDRASTLQIEIRTLRKEEEQAIEMAVAEAVKEAAKSRGFGLVLEMTQAGVAWGADELDLTRNVLECIDHKH
jgi:Skp family chaperone for outer membrane proteins